MQFGGQFERRKPVPAQLSLRQVSSSPMQFEVSFQSLDVQLKF